MHAYLRGSLWAGLAIAVVVHVAAVTGQQRESRMPRVAITFDDLPVHATLPPGVTRAEIATQIVDTLRARRSPPVYGFMNAKGLADEPASTAALRIWRDAGHLLGNHGYAHLDLALNTTGAIEEDIIANERPLQSLMPDGRWRWFRYPFLSEGDTPAKHRRIVEVLTARGYRIAQVTLSFDDWAYSEPYARCAAIRDQAGIDWLRASFLKRAAESLPRGQHAARALFGRDISHVLLLHIGAFTALMLPDVLELLDARGFALTTLEDATADSSYAAARDLPSSRSGPLLDQLMSGRKTPMPKWQEDPFDRLATICR